MTPDERHDETHLLDPTVTAGGSARGASAPALPDTIGGFRIVRVLGQGGMGVVYEAEQPSPRRRVALKVVRTTFVDDLQLRMFEREAATLARLDHPNIGKIYQSGRTEDGRPFFAMELVTGPTLGEWLTRRPAAPGRAEIELRLGLFRQICEAVHYAHQRGVIHRDLKPSNLVVADAAAGETDSSSAATRVRVLDFGLARIVEGDEGATQLTQSGDIKGTLAYMAPEQARGDSGTTDVRTDVYALGVILYELLTRKRPYPVDSGSLLSTIHTICETAPRPLAEAWESSAKLDPDLATIVHTALEKEPSRRYASASAFADDVGRFLTSQPIQARPPSTMYQIRKLVARRKPLFATAAVAVVLLVVAAIGIGVLYVRSRASERVARREAETARRTSDFLVGLFEQANPEHTRGATLTARQVMDEGARRVHSELTGEPVQQARMMHTISRVDLSLGMNDEARRLTDEALALRRRYLPAGDPEIAASVHQRAQVLDGQGDPRAAQAAYEEAIGLYEALGDRGTPDLIDVLGNLAWMHGQYGNTADGNAALDRALALRAARLPGDEARLLKLLNNQSTLRMNAGQPDSALAILDRALALTRRRYGDKHLEVANVLTNISVAHGRAGRFEAAHQNAAQALEIYRSIYGDTHPKVAKGLANVAVALAQQGRRDEARPYMEKSIEALIAIHGEQHPAVAQGRMNLGLLELESGHVPRAIELLSQAVATHERVSNASSSLSTSLYHLASARSQSGNNPEARRLLARVVAIDEKLHGPDSGDVADDLETLGAVERELGNAAEADRLEARMKGIREKLARSPS